MTDAVVYQGEPGAFSELAARSVFSDRPTKACLTFEDAFAAVESGAAARAMIPVENSVAGRVADIHHLLPASPLHIIAEHFEPVRHHLLAPAGVALSDVKRVYSHPMALAQCRRVIAGRGLEAVRAADTAGAARQVAERKAGDEAAIASSLAAEIHGLDTLQADIQDDTDNTTRFVVFARDPERPAKDQPCITSFLFQVRNVPAALYKVLGGFATNGVNMTKLESYQPGGGFTASQFYADVDGHPEDPALVRAFEELQFFSSRFRIVGTYPAHRFRQGRSLAP